MTLSSNSELATPAVVTQRILQRTRATHRKLIPQVALVHRAMAGAGKAIESGIPPEVLGTSLTLKAAKTVELLQATFEEDASLAAHVEGVLSQFREASETLAEAEAAMLAGGLAEEQVQALKGVAVFVSKFHETARRDALLAQLFPAPEVIQADVE